MLLQLSKLILHPYKANSSLNFRRYCFFGFIVLKYANFITSGHTAGQGLPQIRLYQKEGKKKCMRSQTTSEHSCHFILACTVNTKIIFNFNVQVFLG